LGFPRRETILGKFIDHHLRTASARLDIHLVHLLFSANRWEAAAEILRSLREGRHVVVDRYSFSGLAYSIAQGLGRDWCFSWEVGLPAPDVVFLLDIDPSAAAQRPGYGKERYEKVELQQRVRNAFLEEAEKGKGASRWIMLDASLPSEETAKQVN
ncbi:hypothetical protein GUITHDRAFT_43854, partial [Guillardia theta CCMP2712]